MRDIYKNTNENQKRILEALEAVYNQMITFFDNIEIMNDLHEIEKELLKGWE